MERILQSLINKIDKEYLELLFGKGSRIKINKINWLTQLKCYQITLTWRCWISYQRTVGTFRNER